MNNFENDYNIGMEQALIGAIFHYNDDIFRLIDLEPEDFYEPVHQRIFEVIKNRIMRGDLVNAVTIFHLFETDEALLEVGGAKKYFAHLMQEGSGAVLHTKEYSKILLELSRQRKLRSLLSKHDVEYIDSEALLKDILSIHGKKSELVKSRYSVAMKEGETIDEKLPCYSTGIPCIDKNMKGGIYSSKSYAFCAPEKNGKTTLMGTIAYNMAQAGVRNAYIACEMGAKEIGCRDLARAMGKNSNAFLTQRHEKEFQAKLAEVAVKQPKDSYFMDAPGITFDELQLKMYSLVRTKPLEGIFLDYIQLIKGRAKNQSESDFLNEVAQFMADFAKKERIFTAYAAQLNRAGEVYGSAGITKAADWAYKIEMNTAGDEAWLSPIVVRYTAKEAIGTKEMPSLRLMPQGPHFEDASTPNLTNQQEITFDTYAKH